MKVQMKSLALGFVFACLFNNLLASRQKAIAHRDNSQLGVAEDTSDASIACRQVGPIKIVGELKDGERVFDEHRSLVFKKLQVVRFFDRKRNVLVYVAYSDRVIEGSPKNSISAVPIMGWPAP